MSTSDVDSARRDATRWRSETRTARSRSCRVSEKSGKTLRAVAVYSESTLCVPVYHILHALATEHLSRSSDTEPMASESSSSAGPPLGKYLASTGTLSSTSSRCPTT